jgi:hypothetical protein
MEYKLQEGDIIVATYGFNDITNKPYSFLYDFGYYTDNGCVVYIHECKNMQDSYAFKFNQIRLANKDDINNLFWGK